MATATTAAAPAADQIGGASEPGRRPERSWQIGSVQASVFANEVTRESGPNQQTTRTIRNVRLERRYYNEKKEQWESQPTFSLATIHAASAALQRAAAYLEETEGESTRRERSFSATGEAPAPVNGEGDSTPF